MLFRSSPTDILVFALGSCMLTMMGLSAQKNGIDIKGAKFEGYKEMAMSGERRIGKITIVFDMPSGIPSSKRGMLEEAAHLCPVHKSLHPDIRISIKFNYSD